MAGILDLLTKQISGQSLDAISRTIGGDSKATGTAVTAALPMLMAALASNTQKSGGAEALSSALSKDHDGGILDDVAGFLGNTASGNGAGILRHMLGGKQKTVESGLSKSSGLDLGSVAKLLPILAPMVMGALGKKQRQDGLDASGLSNMLGQERKEIEKAMPQMGMVGKFLDTDGDGDLDLGDLGSLAKSTGLLGKLFGNR